MCACSILEILDDTNAQWTWCDTPPLPRTLSSSPWRLLVVKLFYRTCWFKKKGKCLLPVLAPVHSC